MSGPLSGVKVVEFAGIGPGPFAAMVFADYGADVVRIECVGTVRDTTDVLLRGRTIVQLDLRSPVGLQEAFALVGAADILLEGFRPGVMERLGVGPLPCLATNPRLVYGRMTGWGQTGPLAQAAGHDINYIAISGALHATGVPDHPPVPPLNYVGDFGGGGLLLVCGILAALYAVQHLGCGQVVDSAMTDGAALLSSMMYGFKAAGRWNNVRGTNMLDGGAFFYGTYACADERFVAIGSIEAPFYAVLRKHCGLESDPAFDAQMDEAAWPALRERLAAIFRTRTREDWCRLLEGTDACFAPVLDWDEAPRHPHNLARETFFELDGIIQPSPAPRFDRTPSPVPATSVVASIADVLNRWRSSSASV